MNHRIRALACLLAALVFAHYLAAQNVITVDHGPNAEAQQAKPYVVMVSLDGFRYDYAKKYGAKHLLQRPGHQW
jgi:predicted AlkP superfamily pyrophosphatase or phosphodiesterase